LYDPGLIHCIFPVSSGQDKVEQSSREMSASDGDQVILRCNYTTTDTSPYLFWYTQLPNRSPTFILNKYTFGGGTTEDEFKERFSATLDSTSRSVPLTIQDVSVSDSAVYYCALQPTVTQTHSTLIQKSAIQGSIYSGNELRNPSLVLVAYLGLLPINSLVLSLSSAQYNSSLDLLNCGHVILMISSVLICLNKPRFSDTREQILSCTQFSKTR